MILYEALVIFRYSVQINAALLRGLFFRQHVRPSAGYVP
jgi:hypothetical protein